MGGIVPVRVSVFAKTFVTVNEFETTKFANGWVIFDD